MSFFKKTCISAHQTNASQSNPHVYKLLSTPCRARVGHKGFGFGSFLKHEEKKMNKKAPIPKTPIKKTAELWFTSTFIDSQKVWVTYIRLLRPEEVSDEEDTKCPQWFSYFAPNTRIPTHVHNSITAVNRLLYSGLNHGAADWPGGLHSFSITAVFL